MTDHTTPTVVVEVVDPFFTMDPTLPFEALVSQVNLSRGERLYSIHVKSESPTTPGRRMPPVRSALPAPDLQRTLARSLCVPDHRVVLSCQFPEPVPKVHNNGRRATRYLSLALIES